MRLVVGLGNPGPEYSDTRHNAGVLVLEELARSHGIELDQQRYGSRLGRGYVVGQDTVLLAPQTFMNASGTAVAAALSDLCIEPRPETLLVILDDLDLPFGQIRLRPRGGAGGHRGLADILEAIGHRDVGRLRFGIGRPPEGEDPVEYVLEAFSPDERRELPARVRHAAQAIACAFEEGFGVAMNHFN
ncbi:MAG: aminoacyl-tRNA hydrolase [Proteobacteria bacterium]|nr:aminoacyl-tRNA hydrolase [Pseudomonadota bacterium]